MLPVFSESSAAGAGVRAGDIRISFTCQLAAAGGANAEDAHGPGGLAFFFCGLHFLKDCACARCASWWVRVMEKVMNECIEEQGPAIEPPVEACAI